MLFFSNFQLHVLMLNNNIVKNSESLNKWNWFKSCIQTTHPIEFCIFCSHFSYGKKIFDFIFKTSGLKKACCTYLVITNGFALNHAKSLQSFFFCVKRQNKSKGWIALKWQILWETNKFQVSFCSPFKFVRRFFVEKNELQRTTKALISLRGRAGWSAPLLFAHILRRVF